MDLLDDKYTDPQVQVQVPDLSSRCQVCKCQLDACCSSFDQFFYVETEQWHVVITH